MLIGNVAKLANVTPSTIRYYETIGLLTPPPRSRAGYRRYSETTVQELRFIRKAQGLGFSLEEIVAIIKIGRSGKTPCADVLDLIQRRLAEVDERICQLQTFRDQLAGEVVKWTGNVPSTCNGLCQIISSTDVTGPGNK
jgi:DNA-binding transcriptional MerR regulator